MAYTSIYIIDASNQTDVNDSERSHRARRVAYIEEIHGRVTSRRNQISF